MARTKLFVPMLLGLLLTLLISGGCGQKGDLYLPERAPSQQ